MEASNPMELLIPYLFIFMSSYFQFQSNQVKQIGERETWVLFPNSKTYLIVRCLLNKSNINSKS